MFQVIVLGGIALVGAPALPIAAGCGGAISSRSVPADAGNEPTDAAFPSEIAPYMDSGFPQETAPEAIDSSFPNEGPAIFDSGSPTDASTTFDSSFPNEGPPPPIGTGSDQ